MEDVCLQCMVELRWPDGVECPRCACKNVGFVKTRRIWNCKGCKQQFSAKVGTIMEDSPLPLTKWLPAFWLLANTKNGTSSCELARHLGVRQATAWFMLHRIRVAMQQGSIEKLSGTVEADETFIGGKAANKHKHKHKKEEKIHGRGASGKEVVSGLLERGTPKRKGEKKAKTDKSSKVLVKLRVLTGCTLLCNPDKSSKVLVKHIPNTQKETRHGEVKSHVEAGSELVLS